uniref:ERAD-associated E3 ubiquitin-protein ligase component HRD3A n=2 Tax=Physcomitrium patens TaxID=3218 RepID=A0A7I4C8R2_PHYPA
MGLSRWRGGGIILLAVALIVVLSLPALCTAAANSPKKDGSTILLFLGSDSDDNRDDGSLPDGEDGPSDSLQGKAEDAPPEWDEFSDSQDSPRTDEDLDSGSWSQVLEEPSIWDSRNTKFALGIRKMVEAVDEEDPRMLNNAIEILRSEAVDGNAHAQSTLGFLHWMAIGVPYSDAKAYLYHEFAKEGGNPQSKMALAYRHYRNQEYEKAVKLYSELAVITMTSFVSSREGPLLEYVRLNYGLEESKDVRKRFRGEDDDDFQFLEYQARKGHPDFMFQLGVFYYYGLRGVRRDHSKALFWLLKAVEKGESRAFELIGEIYARGYGVERNYTKALECFKAAADRKQHSALNGIGFLYIKGQGVEGKNYTKAREYFQRAAESSNVDGFYNLGILYLKGLGVEKDYARARDLLVDAANKGHSKARYYLAIMLHKGSAGMKKDLTHAAALYKLVAERGPWGRLMRQALEFYIKGNVGKALLLYSRTAELGYEVGQSNAAWLLEKYRGRICIGSSGICTTEERHERAHNLWRHSSEQGNEHASLLLGDAYYYGRGAAKDLERAGEAYIRAKEKHSSQAMFNLGYMHERGLGLPLDLHLAKRYYDEALEEEPAAFVPVTLALTSLWLRQHYSGSFLVKVIDSLPDLQTNLEEWWNKMTVDELDALLVTLLMSLLFVVYVRQRHRQEYAAAAAAAAAPIPMVPPQ